MNDHTPPHTPTEMYFSICLLHGRLLSLCASDHFNGLCGNKIQRQRSKICKQTFQCGNVHQSTIFTFIRNEVKTATKHWLEHWNFSRANTREVVQKKLYWLFSSSGHCIRQMSSETFTQVKTHSDEMRQFCVWCVWKPQRSNWICNQLKMFHQNDQIQCRSIDSVIESKTLDFRWKAICFAYGYCLERSQSAFAAWMLISIIETWISHNGKLIHA